MKLTNEMIRSNKNMFSIGAVDILLYILACGLPIIFIICIIPFDGIEKLESSLLSMINPGLVKISGYIVVGVTFIVPALIFSFMGLYAEVRDHKLLTSMKSKMANGDKIFDYAENNNIKIRRYSPPDSIKNTYGILTCIILSVVYIVLITIVVIDIRTELDVFYTLLSSHQFFIFICTMFLYLWLIIPSLVTSIVKRIYYHDIYEVLQIYK